MWGWLRNNYKLAVGLGLGVVALAGVAVVVFPPVAGALAAVLATADIAMPALGTIGGAAAVSGFGAAYALGDHVATRRSEVENNKLRDEIKKSKELAKIAENQTAEVGNKNEQLLAQIQAQDTKLQSISTELKQVIQLQNQMQAEQQQNKTERIALEKRMDSMPENISSKVVADLRRSGMFTVNGNQQAANQNIAQNAQAANQDNMQQQPQQDRGPNIRRK